MKEKSIALKGPESKYEVTASRLLNITLQLLKLKANFESTRNMIHQAGRFEELTVPGGCLRRTELLSCLATRSEDAR